jgi:hypothetical protein
MYTHPFKKPNQALKHAGQNVITKRSPNTTSLGTVNLVAPIDRNFIDISAIIRLRLCTFELSIE